MATKKAVSKKTVKKPVAKKTVAKKPVAKKTISEELDGLGVSKFLNQYLVACSTTNEEAVESAATITATVDSNNDWMRQQLIDAASKGKDCKVGDIMGTEHHMKVDGKSVAIVTKATCPVTIAELVDVLPAKKGKKSKK